MTLWRDLPEILELEGELDELIDSMLKAKDFEEFKMYREMALVNINLIKLIQSRR